MKSVFLVFKSLHFTVFNSLSSMEHYFVIGDRLNDRSKQEEGIRDDG